MTLNKNPNAYKAWALLKDHFKSINSTTISDKIINSPQKKVKFFIKTPIGIFDFAKNNISDETIGLFDELFLEADLDHFTQQMFSGKTLNHTENRAVLHTALRNKTSLPVKVSGKNIMPQVSKVLRQMELFSDDVRSGKWKGYTGKSIKNIVNIGIGGSDLGPKMAYQALLPYKKENLNVYFVSNVDGSALSDVLENLNPETTLFIIASKIKV